MNAIKRFTLFVLILELVQTTKYIQCDILVKKDTKTFFWSFEDEISKSSLHVFNYAFNPSPKEIDKSLNVTSYKEYSLQEATGASELTSNAHIYTYTESGKELSVVRLKVNEKIFVDVTLDMSDPKDSKITNTDFKDKDDAKKIAINLKCSLKTDDKALNDLLERNKKYKHSLYICLTISIVITISSLVALIIITIREAKNK